MSTEPQYPKTRTEPQPARERAPGLLTEPSVEDRADVEEDRRRQRELDQGELGGEA
jgi:hypothetical protein